MTDENAQLKKIKPELPGGFRDYGPAEARMKQWVLDTARRTFELFGFEPLETSAVQKTEILIGGESDSQKIIFNVKGSQETPYETRSHRDAEDGVSLRFDLTVPLARFIAANPEIPKPFKRYEIGRVWRGERQQAGRYREFMQADVDIIGSSLPSADAEIIAIIYQTLKNLGLNDFLIKINDRKELGGLPAFARFPEEKLWNVLRIIDRKDKIGERGVAEELRKDFGDDIPEKIGVFFAKPSEATGALAKMGEALDAMGIEKKYWQVDRSMVRGLSYYTGLIFEATLTDAPEIGSIFGGGRYNDLIARFTGQKIPAVGASLGVDRLMAAMEKLGRIAPETSARQALILNLDPSLESKYLALAAELRAAGIPTALYTGNETSFQGQLAYAVKKEIQYAVIWGGEEKKTGRVSVKNLTTREQREMPREKIVGYFHP